MMKATSRFATTRLVFVCGLLLVLTSQYFLFNKFQLQKSLNEFNNNLQISDDDRIQQQQHEDDAPHTLQASNESQATSVSTPSSSSSSSSKNEQKPPLTVAIIGCGPGGMFVLYHLSEMRRELTEKLLLQNKYETTTLSKTNNNTKQEERQQLLHKQLNSLPHITCFEKEHKPGGVWRADRAANSATVAPLLNNNNTNEEEQEQGEQDEHHTPTQKMYEALWMNGAKEGVEFFDYTFVDHFGFDVAKQLPVFCPRQLMLEYFTARVLRNDPHLLRGSSHEHDVTFSRHDGIQIYYNTIVDHVDYQPGQKQFAVTYTYEDAESASSTPSKRRTKTFDRCIWAASQTGKPLIPSEYQTLLNVDRNSKSIATADATRPFLGDILHSSQVGSVDFERLVKNKRIFLVGDAYSALDLALMALKLGAEHVYVYSRSGQGPATNLAAGTKKVTVLQKKAIVNVTQHGLILQSHDYDFDLHRYVVDTSKKEQHIDDLSTIVFCTGYSMNLEMLDPSLRIPYENYLVGDALPKDWKMTQDYNHLTSQMENVVLDPSQKLWPSPRNRFRLGLYRDIFLISNPKMMFFVIPESDEHPLLVTDIKAKLMVQSLISDSGSDSGFKLPSPSKMIQTNKRELREQMDVGFLRQEVDWEFRRAILGKSNEKTGNDSRKKWLRKRNKPKSIVARKNGRFTFEEMREDRHVSFVLWYMTKLERLMVDSDYGLRFFEDDGIGDNDSLTEIGERYFDVLELDEDFSNLPGKTFRDVDPSNFRSVYTDIPAAPLKKPWMELEEDAYAFAEGICPQLDGEDCRPK